MSSPPAAPAAATGATLVAQCLEALGVRVVFGLVGIPIVEVADACLARGIRFLAFRNEQAAAYAAGAYGHLSGRPGVCLVVGGPGVLHALAGIGNATANASPFLLLAGSAETPLLGRGAFQELDAVALLRPQIKRALRPASLAALPQSLRDAYRAAFHGVPGPTFVDLPADLIRAAPTPPPALPAPISDPSPAAAAAPALQTAAAALRAARAPLFVVGPGASSLAAAAAVRALLAATRLPFLPTPQGKGVAPDTHPLNAARARSTALQHADVAVLLGARRDWMLHFGAPPKWSRGVRFVRVGLDAGTRDGNEKPDDVALVGDVASVCEQLTEALRGWNFEPRPLPGGVTFPELLGRAARANAVRARAKAEERKMPMTLHRALEVIRRTLATCTPPGNDQDEEEDEGGGIVYVSEGANTMDVARSVFDVNKPRRRLDAGANATMGVGMGYAIAAHAYYNPPLFPGESRGKAQQRTKVVCLEGDSAFGFSAMEVETMARYDMDVLIFVMNNGGVYHGDADSEAEWQALQRASREAASTVARPGDEGRREAEEPRGLRSTSLGWETRYEALAEMCGGEGRCVRTEGELEEATRQGFESDKLCVVNVIIESGKGAKLEFAWQAGTKASKL